MNLTNKHGYNETVVRAIQHDTYSKGDSQFSCTTLIGPARPRVLETKHKDEIVTDVDDEVFKLYGHLGHGILERAGDTLKQVVEKRLFGVVDGIRISAQIDSLSLVNNCLTDWKFTTVYAFMKGTAPKPEWVYQLNIQLELLRMNNMDAEKLEIVGLLRDWRPKEAKTDPRYPTKIAAHKIPMFSRDEIQSYISKRIKAHLDAEIELPKCTALETWNGNRCAGYCSVNTFCTQYQDKIKKEISK